MNNGPLRTIGDLRLLGRALRPPFRLLIKWQEREMLFEADMVLGHVPQQRLLCRGRLDNEDVVLKLFLHPGRQKKAFQREFDGVRALISAGVPVVNLQGRAELVQSKDPVVLYDYVPAAEPLSKVWDERDERGQLELFNALIDWLAQLHRAQVGLSELHFNHFLIADERLICVDSGGAQRVDAPLPALSCLSDLALLQAQTPAHWDERLATTLETYAHARGWTTAGQEADGGMRWAVPQMPPTGTFAELVRARRHARQEAFARQGFRSDAGVWREDYGRYRIFCMRNEFESLQSYLRDPEQWLFGARLRDAGPAGSIYVWEHLYIKRYNVPQDWRGRLRNLGRSPAERAWANTQRLLALNIPTARPVACVIERGLLNRTLRSWVVTELPPLESLASRLESGWSPADRDLRALWQMFRALARARLTHGDLKASNVLCGEGLQGPIGGLIDLDRMRGHDSDADFAAAWKTEMEGYAKNFAADSRLAQRFLLTMPVIDDEL